MANVRTLLAMFVLMLTTLYAQQPLQPGEKPPTLKIDRFSIINDQHVPRIQAAQYLIFDSLVNAYSYFSMRQQPLWYDPDGNMLVTIKRGALNGNEIYFRYSGDTGKTWSDPYGPIELPGSVPRYPSIVSTILPSPTVPDTVFVYIFPIVVNNAFGQAQLGMAIAGVHSTQQLPGIENDQGQLYSLSTSSKLKIFGDGEFAIIVQELFPPANAPTSENNALGVILFDIFNEEPIAFIPPAWASTNFRDPGQPGFRTSTIVDIDLDDQGNLYLGAFGSFIASGNPNRSYPGVSQSTDGGETWSEFDIFPSALLEEYALENGADPDSTFFNFTSKGFVVTGEGEYSFVLNCFEVNATKQNPLRHLVEVSKQNGQWTIRKVADISGFIVAYQDTENNQTNNEVQLSRTPDRQFLLAKWLEFFVYTSQNDLNGDGITPDTVVTTDVLVSYRHVSDTRWSEPINVTESLLLDRITHIPFYLPPGLTNIPLLNVITIPDPNTEVTPLDQLVTAQRILLRSQWVTMSWFSLGVNSVENSEAPAEENVHFTANLLGNDRLWVSISAAEPSLAAVDLYAISGQHIAQILPRTVVQQKELLYDLRNLPSGAYLVRFSTPNGTATKMILKY